jgi:glycosyltransferase involved in cell wall biosynthesis
VRILYASERPPYPFFLGGAARCAHMLLRSLEGDLGVECAAVGSADYAVTPWAFPDPAEYATLGVRSARPDGAGGTIDCGYPVHVLPDFSEGLSDFIDDFKPDVIWSQLEGARDVLEVAAAKGIQGLFYVHDAEFDRAELRAIADLGCHVVCSSGFLAEKAQRVIGRPVHVVYPAAELYFGTESDSDGHVTMINPHRVKGLQTFLEIAKRIPAEKFLLVESWKLDDAALCALEEQLARVPNVKFMRRVSDMRVVYGQTKLLLVPSVWEEGFGMVAIEAQSCRIPVIASARGGLPESVGEGGILIRDYLNPDAWLEAVGRVLGDAAEYGEWAERAFRHAGGADFSPPYLAQQFLQTCSAAPVHTGLIARGLRAARRQLEGVPVIGRLFREAMR